MFLTDHLIFCLNKPQIYQLSIFVCTVQLWNTTVIFLLTNAVLGHPDSLLLLLLKSTSEEIILLKFFISICVAMRFSKRPVDVIFGSSTSILNQIFKTDLLTFILPIYNSIHRTILLPSWYFSHTLYKNLLMPSETCFRVLNITSLLLFKGRMLDIVWNIFLPLPRMMLLMVNPEYLYKNLSKGVLTSLAE